MPRSHNYSRGVRTTPRRHQLARRQVPAWLFPAGVISSFVGLACWLLPLRVFRMLVKVGIYPTPEKSQDSAETWIAIDGAFAFMGKLETAGAVLAIAGLIVVARHYFVGRGGGEPRHQSNEPISGATYVVEEDGEERIVPPTRS